MNLKVCVVAAPLIARSGVYKSTIELVTAARAAGHDWTAVLGVSKNARGMAIEPSSAVQELPIEPSGLGGVLRLGKLLTANPLVRDADVVISMIPQTDMALATTSLRWVAYLRGLPWPARGEASPLRTFVWRTLEKTALRRADAVWATTEILARGAGKIVDRIVPPGILPPTQPPALRPGASNQFVWAARYSADKNPALFMSAIDAAGAQGTMYGSGPLEDSLRAAAPESVNIGGWVSSHELWANARAYVGTSSREAFGRSAVEAAMLGIPLIISDEFGCAEMLYTDGRLRSSFVLPIDDHSRWVNAIESLNSDAGLHREVSEHVQHNAQRLTIDSAVRNVDLAIQDLLA